jgi:receptor expression-enhancing protein 1/2/3/4
LYLIAPGTQGAKILYQNHVHPFLYEHEVAIDDFISSAHERAKTAGLTYLKQAIELLKQHLLGLPPAKPSPPATPTSLSYTQSLIARFNLPSARPTFPTGSTAANTATDFYTLLASAVSAATSGAPSASTDNTQARDLSNSGTLIPPTMSGADRITFIATQRERLSTLLSALDKEALNLNAYATPRHVPSMSLDGHQTPGSSEDQPRPASAMSGLSKSRSEVDFERIENDEDTDSNAPQKPSYRRQASITGSGSWMPWSWGAGAAPETKAKEVDPSINEAGASEGKSSGVET